MEREMIMSAASRWACGRGFRTKWCCNMGQVGSVEEQENHGAGFCSAARESQYI